MAERPEGRGRRTFVPALVGGVGGAGLAAVAGNQPWVEPVAGAGTHEIARIAAAAADASAPPVTALALVALASWGVLAVARGRFRPVMAWFSVLVAAALVVVIVLAWAQAPDALVEQYQVAGASRTAWGWVAAGAAAVVLLAALLAARDSRSWPQMGSRYDAPGAGAAQEPAHPPAEEQSSLDLWRSLDEGHDPTEDRPH